jgi:hypothetical protein
LPSPPEAQQKQDGLPGTRPVGVSAPPFFARRRISHAAEAQRISPCFPSLASPVLAAPFADSFSGAGRKKSSTRARAFVHVADAAPSSHPTNMACHSESHVRNRIIGGAIGVGGTLLGLVPYLTRGEVRARRRELPRRCFVPQTDLAPSFLRRLRPSSSPRPRLDLTHKLSPLQFRSASASLETALRRPCTTGMPRSRSNSGSGACIVHCADGAFIRCRSMYVRCAARPFQMAGCSALAQRQAHSRSSLSNVYVRAVRREECERSRHTRRQTSSALVKKNHIDPSVARSAGDRGGQSGQNPLVQVLQRTLRPTPTASAKRRPPWRHVVRRARQALIL